MFWREPCETSQPYLEQPLSTRFKRPSAQPRSLKGGGVEVTEILLMVKIQHDLTYTILPQVLGFGSTMSCRIHIRKR